MSETATTSASKTTIELFLLRFAEALRPAYLRLLYYAAMPLVVTPELLHYLRNAFVREAPWVAEADLLLAEAIFEEKNFEQYVMQLAVRQYLLGNASQFLGEGNMQQAAHLLVRYISQQLSQSAMSPEDLQTQQWAALLYLEEHYDQVVSEIVKAMQASFQASAVADLSGRANYESMLELVRQLAPALGKTPELVDNARIWQGILHQEIDPTTWPPGQLTQEVEVAGVRLPSFAHILPMQQTDKTTATFESNFHSSSTTIESNAAEQQPESTDTKGTAIYGTGPVAKKNALWQPGTVLHVAFLDGPEELQNRVMQIARQWSNYVNLAFEPAKSNDAEIRVSFQADKGSWSYIGNDALSVPKDSPTMNFGWVTMSTPQDQLERAVWGNFSLAIGLVQSHMNPDANIPWDKETVIKELSGPPNHWTKETIEHNLFTKLKPESAVYAPIDPETFWQPNVQPHWLTHKLPTKQSRGFSKGDITFFASLYPPGHYVSNKVEATKTGDLGEKVRVAFTLQTTGSKQLRLGNYETAKKMFEQAIALFAQVGATEDEANCRLQLGNVYLGLEERSNAIRSFEQALSLFQSLNYQFGVATVYQHFGNLYQTQHDYEYAIRYYQQALAIFENLKDIPGVATSLHGLGDTFRLAHQIDQAQNYYQQALAQYRQLGLQVGTASILNSLGLLYTDKGEQQQAMAVFEEALTLYLSIGDENGKASVRENIAALQHKQVDKPEVGKDRIELWTQELTNLRNQLATLYPTPEDARRLVSDAELNPALIEFHGKPINIWHNILNEAQKYNKVAALLEAVIAEYPNDPELLAAYESYMQSQPTPPAQPIKILFLGANPQDLTQLKLAEEVRAIDHTLRSAAHREHFDLKQQGAVRYSDLQESLLRYQPDIVHFSGHGRESDEILVLDDKGESHAISGRALGALFAMLKDNIRCVVLNACYSQPQAEAIAQHIDFVIGMSSAIPDEASYQFAASFYQGLADGRTVKTAFDLGCSRLKLALDPSTAEPKLFALHRDPAQVRFVSVAVNKPVAPATQESRSNIHIDTGGGAYIAGSVDTSGGDFVGRDKRSK